MTNLFPEGGELIDLEIETLKKILNCAAFRCADLTSFLTSVNTSYGNRGPRSSRFSFHGHFCIADDHDVRRVDIGARVILSSGGAYEEVSYFFAISGFEGNDKHILRKIHFDFEPLANRHQDEAKPSLHFQIAGTLPPPMELCGYTDAHLKHLAPFYEKPRIPALPFSLAILLNIIFHEFRGNDFIRKILDDSTWRGVVNAAERAVLLPYMKECYEFIVKSDRDELFVSHLLYGLDR